MRFCEECGAQLEDDAKFCEECGAVISDSLTMDEELREESQEELHEETSVEEATETKDEVADHSDSEIVVQGSNDNDDQKSESQKAKSVEGKIENKEENKSDNKKAVKKPYIIIGALVGVIVLLVVIIAVMLLSGQSTSSKSRNKEEQFKEKEDKESKKKSKSEKESAKDDSKEEDTEVVAQVGEHDVYEQFLSGETLAMHGELCDLYGLLYKETEAYSSSFIYDFKLNEVYYAYADWTGDGRDELFIYMGIAFMEDEYSTFNKYIILSDTDESLRVIWVEAEPLNGAGVSFHTNGYKLSEPMSSDGSTAEICRLSGDNTMMSIISYDIDFEGYSEARKYMESIGEAELQLDMMALDYERWIGIDIHVDGGMGSDGQLYSSANIPAGLVCIVAENDVGTDVDQKWLVGYFDSIDGPYYGIEVVQGDDGSLSLRLDEDGYGGPPVGELIRADKDIYVITDGYYVFGYVGFFLVTGPNNMPYCVAELYTDDTYCGEYILGIE